MSEKSEVLQYSDKMKMFLTKNDNATTKHSLPMNNRTKNDMEMSDGMKNARINKFLETASDSEKMEKSLKKDDTSENCLPMNDRIEKFLARPSDSENMEMFLAKYVATKHLLPVRAKTVLQKGPRRGLLSKSEKDQVHADEQLASAMGPLAEGAYMKNTERHQIMGYSSPVRRQRKQLRLLFIMAQKGEF